MSIGKTVACRRCRERGKDWEGGDPVCGFDQGGLFSASNWMCATLCDLRERIEASGQVSWCNDTYFGTVGFEFEDEDFGFLTMAWYKHHGETYWAGVVFDGRTPKPLTLDVAERILGALPAPDGQSPGAVGTLNTIKADEPPVRLPVGQTPLRVDAWAVLSRCVEEGIAYGWRRARKHVDNPSEDAVKVEIENAVMNAVCEYFRFSDD